MIKRGKICKLCALIKVRIVKSFTNKTLTTGPFSNTCEADEVSPEVEAGVVVRLRCLQP
jgi:hypothetical protein